MFKIESISFWHNQDSQTYHFTTNTFIYGPNTVGKTAMTKAIDFVLGSSDKLTYDGLDNIDFITAHLCNDMTELWIKRDKANHYYYKRTLDSDYSEVSSQNYKDNIGLIFTNSPNSRFLEIYSKVFNEKPTFRSFSFINYMEEKGLGDLSIVFTKGKDLKHQIRIREIMDFFFNYENIEQIYEKEILLEKKKKELEKLNTTYNDYQNSVLTLKKLFNDLNLMYTGIYDKDYTTFIDYKGSFSRDVKNNNSDLVYLTQVSFSLSEQMKLYSFMNSQTEMTVKRKERINRLLSILKSAIDGNDQYSNYTAFIINTINDIDNENIILSLTDYKKSIKAIQDEKDKIDKQILAIKAAGSELSYEDAMKKIGLLEHIFIVLKDSVNICLIKNLEDEIKQLNEDLKRLRTSFNHNKITAFNTQLTNLYINSDLDIKHLQEDKKDIEFSLEFDPFKLCLFAKHKENNIDVKFMPGSLTRLTHLQLLAYITMFDFLNKNFNGFIYMPVIIIDSANQPMGVDIFEKVYPEIIKKASDIGIQTIFLSKDKISGITENDLIDISNGLNKFHAIQ